MRSRWYDRGPILPPTGENQQLQKGQMTGHLIAGEEAGLAKSGLAGFLTRLKHLLIGRPMPSEQLVHERVTKIKALAVFASDALSSTAYATEEILLVLMAAGSAALSYTIPIAIAIAALLAIVAYSYRQTILKYPKGGGTYVVTKDNFGHTPALVAGSALMIDYVLTVSVSVSAGIAAITSAFPALMPIQVWMAVLAVLLLTLANLRGVRESANIFTLPTYAFIFSIVILLVIGTWRAYLGMPPVEPVTGVVPKIAEPLSIFLILRAFASGCSALTGTEAISDGVPAFKDPQAHNAVITLIWMAVTLGTLFLGISFLSQHYHILPNPNETVLSQLARAVVGRNAFYYIVQAATALILIFAANTSFSDFPRLAFFMAQDHFMPRQFVFRGDRLSLSTGILSLGILSGVLIIAVGADVDHLIPMYAVGVFTAFTFSQSSMVKRWWVRKEEGWKKGLVINGLGAITTAIVALVITTTKFVHGAWMVVLLLPIFVVTMLGIRRHYMKVKDQLAIQKRTELQSFPLPPSKTLVLVSSLNRATARTIRYAMSLSEDAVALHVAESMEAGKNLREQWNEYHLNMPLVILESPYRSLVSPIMAYLDSIEAEKQRTPVTIVLSEFVPIHWWQYLLHNQDAARLKIALFFRRNVAVIDVPYHLN